MLPTTPYLVEVQSSEFGAALLHSIDKDSRLGLPGGGLPWERAGRAQRDPKLLTFSVVSLT